MTRPARARSAGRPAASSRTPTVGLRLAAPLLALLLLAGVAPAQGGDTSEGALAAASYPLFPVQGSAVDGTLQLTARAEGGTVAVTTLPGNADGSRHAVGLFEGDCGPDRPLVTSLGVVGDLPEDPFVARMTLEAPIEDLVARNLFAYVFAGPDLEGGVVACGEVGEGALAPSGGADAANGAGTGTTAGRTTDAETGGATDADAGSGTPGERAGASDAAPPGEPGPLASLRSFSYGVFPVQGSGISGQLQATERAEGGTRLLLTLQGIDAGDLHGAALFRGDCGPDRERVLELPPVGSSVPDDPFATELVAPLEVGEIADGDLFVYVYAAPEAEGEVVACGEIGVGANR